MEVIEEEINVHEGYLGFHRRARKLTLDYGNTLTGRAWADNATGYIELAADGSVVIKKTERSKTVEPVLLHNIVRITSGAQVCYKHPLFHTHLDKPPVIEETAAVDARALRRISIGRHGSTAE